MKLPTSKTLIATLTAAVLSTGAYAQESTLEALFGFTSQEHLKQNQKESQQNQDSESFPFYEAENNSAENQQLLENFFDKFIPQKAPAQAAAPSAQPAPSAVPSAEPNQNTEAATLPKPTNNEPEVRQILPASDDLTLEQLYKKYQNRDEVPQSETQPQASTQSKTPAPEVYQIDSAGWPGVIIGPEQGKGESAFNYAWPYRHLTFEMHFADQTQLSAMIYSLAVHAKDISADTPRDKFYRGVSGFHYSVEQICDWLNDPNKIPLNEAERGFVQQLLNHSVITLKDNKYQGDTKIKHVLAASFSKKRTFERNLRHERLHIYYDEDAKFRQQCLERFNKLSESEKTKVLKDYSNYNQENLPQLIEEWAVGSIDEEKLPAV